MKAGSYFLIVTAAAILCNYPLHLHAQPARVAETTTLSVEEILLIADERISSQSYSEAGNLLKEALRIAEQEKSEPNIALARYKIGNLLRLTGDNSSALNHFNMAVEYFSRTGDSLKISNTWNNLGLVYTNLGDHSLALDYLLKALAICRSKGYIEEESNVLNNIGRLYSIIGENEKAIDYFTLSLEIKVKLGNSDGIANGMNNLGVIYRRKGNHEKALQLFEESLQMYRAANDKTGIANSLNNLGILYHDAGAYDKAIKNFREVLEIREALGDKSGITMGLYNLGFMNSLKGNTSEAIGYFQSSIESAQAIEENNYLLKGYEALYELYRNTGKLRLALEYHEKFHLLKDSLFNETSRDKLMELQTKYQTLQKEKEIESLRIESRKNRQVMIALAALLFVIFLLISFIFYVYRKDKKTSKLLKKKNKEISKQKEKLELANDRINENLKLKELFFASANHEIRGPLNIIIGYTELLEKKLMNPELFGYLESIKANTKALKKLVNDILELSVIESAMFRLDQEPVEMDKFIHEIGSSFQERIAGSRISFRVANEIPKDLCLSLDEVRIRQIIMNLLENSLKFTTEGIIRLGLEVHYMNEDNTWTLALSVEDTGTGIPPETEKYIFEPGYSTSPNNGLHPIGYGLGLQIVKKLVDYMKGTIKLRSSPGNGTLIEVFIPFIQSAISRSEAISDVIESPDPIQTGLKLNKNQLNLLIVDDSELNRRLLAIMLKDQPFRLIETESAEEALEIMRNEKIDIILLDIYMPVMDGYKAISQMREIPEYKNTPVIAVTASASEEEKGKVEQAGFNGYITKPVMKEVMIREINLLLKKKG